MTSLAEIKKSFNEFHNQHPIRLVSGSLVGTASVNGQNEAPGTFGYLGLIKIGDFQIKVGKKAVKQPIYLSELDNDFNKHNGQWDLILGRSFIEKRKIKFDQFDKSKIIFQDNENEEFNCELVSVKDAITGQELPI